MANYTITNGSTNATQLTATSTYAPLITMGGSTTAASLRRGKQYDVLVGTDGAPGDTALDFQIVRVTLVSTTGAAAGTLTAAPPLDPADVAALTTVTINSTGTPTVTVPGLWFIGMNQRASYRWVCAPGSELVWPATASNGLSLQAKSASYTGALTGTIMFQEQ